MRNRILVIVSCLALAACSPQAPSAPETPTSAVSTSPVSDTHKLEAQAMAAHPGYARRDGGVLTLIFNGKDAVRLDDGNAKGCASMDDCAGWTFRGVEPLQSATGLDSHALVARDDGGESTRYAFIGTEPDLTWFASWPAVSPSGQYIASASDDGSLILTDWATAYPHTVYDFGPDCRFIAWTSDREAQVRCTYPGGRATLAVLALYNDVWRLGDTQEIDPAAADIQPVEGTKLKKRVLIAKARQGQTSDAAALKAECFERLD